MKTEKLTLADCYKYPNAKIIYRKDSPVKYSCYKNVRHFLKLNFSATEDLQTHIINDCKLILRPLDSLTVDEEIKAMHFVIKSTMVRHLNLPEHEQKKFDYLRSIKIDIDNFEQQGKAVYENANKGTPKMCL